MSKAQNSTDDTTGQIKPTWVHFIALVLFFTSAATSVGWLLSDGNRRAAIEENHRLQNKNATLETELAIARLKADKATKEFAPQSPTDDGQ